MKTLRVLALTGAMASVAAPAIFLLPGCSGGSGSGLTNPTPSPVNIVVAAPVVLSAGQSGSLSMTRTGNNLAGTLTVNAATAQQLKVGRAFSFTIPTGVYSFSGTVDASGNFSVTGNFPAPAGTFTLTGAIPTTSSAGNFTLTANGQTVTGTLPVITTPTVTATATTTATPPGGPNTVTGSLTFANVSGNFNGTSTTLSGGLGAFQKATTSAGQSLVVTVNFTQSLKTRGISLTLNKTGNIAAGDTFNLGQFGTNGFATGTYAEITAPAVTGPIFVANGGQVRITSLTDTNLTVEFLNTAYSGAAIGSVNAQGSFQLKGSLGVKSAT